ncbi:MAG: hypothetical protein HQK49_22590 [Oligoflexia bacterium]|nr:hypothetical protein [Oligoflexia bacterium]
MKSRLVILDANVIIKAFEKNFWKSLVSQYDISINSIVLRNEVYFYTDENGQQVNIDLTVEITSGKIKEITATADEIESLIKKVNPSFLNRIDDGEQEALALLLTGRFDEYKYCTGDTRAIKALASLELGIFGVSLEELLSAIGQKDKLPDLSYSKEAFERKKVEGFQERELFLRK